MQSSRLLELLKRTASLAVGVTEHAGRGLVAKALIRQGSIVLTEEPIVCAPAPQHRGRCCYSCLRVFQDAAGPLAQLLVEANGQTYCSATCADGVAQTFAEVEGPGGANLAALTDHCKQHKERFPLLAARLACSIVQGSYAADAASQVRLLATRMPKLAGTTSRDAHGLVSGLAACCRELHLHCMSCQSLDKALQSTTWHALCAAGSAVSVLRQCFGSAARGVGGSPPAHS